MQSFDSFRGEFWSFLSTKDMGLRKKKIGTKIRNEVSYWTLSNYFNVNSYVFVVKTESWNAKKKTKKTPTKHSKRYLRQVTYFTNWFPELYWIQFCPFLYKFILIPKMAAIYNSFWMKLSDGIIQQFQFIIPGLSHTCFPKQWMTNQERFWLLLVFLSYVVSNYNCFL